MPWRFTRESGILARPVGRESLTRGILAPGGGPPDQIATVLSDLSTHHVHASRNHGQRPLCGSELTPALKKTSQDSSSHGILIIAARRCQTLSSKKRSPAVSKVEACDQTVLIYCLFSLLPSSPRSSLAPALAAPGRRLPPCARRRLSRLGRAFRTSLPGASVSSSPRGCSRPPDPTE